MLLAELEETHLRDLDPHESKNHTEASGAQDSVDLDPNESPPTLKQPGAEGE